MINPVDLYIQLSPKLASKNKKGIYKKIENLLNTIDSNAKFEDYEEFAKIARFHYQNSSFDVLIGPVTGGKKNEWIVVVNPPTKTLLQHFGLKETGRQKKYDSILKKFIFILSKSNYIESIDKYVEKRLWQ